MTCDGQLWRWFYLIVRRAVCQEVISSSEFRCSSANKLQRLFLSDPQKTREREALLKRIRIGTAEVSSYRATLFNSFARLFKSAVHGRIVNAQMRRDPIKPVTMIVCLDYRSVSALANIRASDGLAALNCTCGILRSVRSCVILDRCLAT